MRVGSFSIINEASAIDEGGLAMGECGDGGGEWTTGPDGSGRIYCGVRSDPGPSLRVGGGRQLGRGAMATPPPG